MGCLHSGNQVFIPVREKPLGRVDVGSPVDSSWLFNTVDYMGDLLVFLEEQCKMHYSILCKQTVRGCLAVSFVKF